jgi:hypothetical protein
MHKAPQPVTRRDALCRIGNGFGMLAFAGLVGDSLDAAQKAAKDVKLTGGLHHPARAKHVIFLFMNGGLSQVDSFDPKPMLDKYHGQPLPGGSIATERKTGALMKSPFTFKKYGQVGMDVSELFPNVGGCADDICFVRSVYTDIPNHEPSMLMMNTGYRSAVPRSARGSPTGSAPTTRTCLATSCCVRIFRPRWDRRCGTTRFSRPCTKARSSPTRWRSPIRLSARTSIRRS